MKLNGENWKRILVHSVIGAVGGTTLWLKMRSLPGMNHKCHFVYSEESQEKIAQ